MGQNSAFLLQQEKRFSWVEWRGEVSTNEEHGELGTPEKGPGESEDHGVRVRTGRTPELHGGTRGHQ